MQIPERGLEEIREGVTQGFEKVKAMPDGRAKYNKMVGLIFTAFNAFAPQGRIKALLKLKYSQKDNLRENGATYSRYAITTN